MDVSDEGRGRGCLDAELRLFVSFLPTFAELSAEDRERVLRYLHDRHLQWVREPVGGNRLELTDRADP